MNLAFIITNFFKSSYKIFLAVTITVVFFLGYNEFLIDRSLESLNFALAEVSTAESMQDTNGLDIIIDCAIIKEVIPKSLDTMALANLTFTQNIVEYGKLDQQLKDVQFLLKEVTKKKNAKRGFFLAPLDRINIFIISLLGKVSDFANFLPGPGREFPAGKTALMLPPEARIYEKLLDYENAKLVYENFAKDNPNSRLLALAKLRLAYLYQRTSDLEKAENMYKTITDFYPNTKESEIAKRMLWYINDLRKAFSEKTVIAEKINSPITTKEEAVQLYYRLGSVDTILRFFGDAEESFKKLVEMEPSTPLAAKAEFNIAMNYKLQNNFEKSKENFRLLIQKYPNSDFIPDAHYQVADTLYREKKYDEAIDELKELTKKYGYSPLGSLAQFQVGYIYLVDANNIDNAMQNFQTLNKNNPLSEYSLFFKEMAGLKPSFNIIENTLKNLAYILIHRLTHRWGGKDANGRDLQYTIPFELGNEVRFSCDAEEEYLNAVGELRHPKRILPQKITGVAELYRYHVDFINGKVFFSFVVKIKGLPKPIDGNVLGHFMITKDKNFRFIAEKGKIWAIPLPGFIINYLTKPFHKLMHEAKLPYIFHELTSAKGHFIAKGVTDKQLVEKINGWLNHIGFHPDFVVKYEIASDKEKEEYKILRGPYLKQRRYWDTIRAESFIEKQTLQ